MTTPTPAAQLRAFDELVQADALIHRCLAGAVDPRDLERTIIDARARLAAAALVLVNERRHHEAALAAAAPGDGRRDTGPTGESGTCPHCGADATDGRCWACGA
jgi:hypothetical protein